MTLWQEITTNWGSIKDIVIAALVVGLGAAGTYLMLPHRHGHARPRAVFGAGTVAAGLGLLGFMAYWSPPGPLLPSAFLYLFGLVSVVSAVLTITSRDPVHSALWFASVVLASSGLFLLADAPFLAAGTIIVYAGAIVVTFLFVIMLAQMEGKARLRPRRPLARHGHGDQRPGPLVPPVLAGERPHRQGRRCGERGRPARPRKRAPSLL